MDRLAALPAGWWSSDTPRSSLSRYLTRGSALTSNRERTRRQAQQVRERAPARNNSGSAVANLLETVGLEMEEGKRRGSDRERKEEGSSRGYLTGSTNDTDRVCSVIDEREHNVELYPWPLAATDCELLLRSFVLPYVTPGYSTYARGRTGM